MIVEGLYDILIIEDDLEFRYYLELQIRRSGLRDANIYEASSLSAAKEILDSHDISIVLTDLNIIDSRGIETFRSEHVAKDLPIIGLSANSMAIDEEQCLEVGMDCFLTKPLEIDVIDKTLKYLIAGNNKEDEGEEVPNTNFDETEFDGVLDYKVLHQLSLLDSTDNSFIQSLIDTFLNMGPELIDELNSACDNCDQKLLSQFAHKLKGCSRNLGAYRLSQACEELEICQSKDSSDFIAKVEKIAIEFSHAKRALTSKFAS